MSNYALLNEIEKSAWAIIATTVEKLVAPFDERAVAAHATGVAFTENLLRDVLPLTPDQQRELIGDLASETIKKSRFTELAKAYRVRNDLYRLALQQLGDLGEDSTAKLYEEVYSGSYDTDKLTERWTDFASKGGKWFCQN